MKKNKHGHTEYWEWYGPRREWICVHGVGHYDPRYVKNTTHGCDGCCGRDDFPGRDDVSDKKDGGGTAA